VLSPSEPTIAVEELIMCTLVAFYKVYQDYPQVVGVNRDELLSRKGMVPRLIEGQIPIYAPIDPKEGGTWIGVNQAGLVVAILNRISEKEWDVAGPRSRGLICLDALRKASAGDVLAMVRQEVGRRLYNKFTLLCMDAEHAFVARYDGDDSLSWVELVPGVHVLVNYGPEEQATTESLKRVKERSERRQRKAMEVFRHPSAEAQEAIEELRGLFQEHEDGICQHGPQFGTTSSTIIALGKEAIFLHADGSPCTSAYEDYSHLLETGGGNQQTPR